MRNVVLAGLVALVMMCPGQVALAGDDATARLRGFLADTEVVTAAFQQELSDADGRLVEVAAGHLLIARPNRLRWDYSEPEQVVMADGEKLWLFDREVDQLTVSWQAEMLRGSPAALLSGDPAAVDEFRVTKTFVADGIDWIELAPLAEDVDFSSVRIGFAGDELAAMVLVDQLGQVTDIRFSDVGLNGALAENAFELDVPDYVDVIDKTTAALTE